MRIVSYADIHFCDTWKLISLQDVVDVHRRLAQYVREHQPDWVIFLGDRFRARQPRDAVRAAADECLLELHDALGPRGRLLVLPGNHDKYSESLGAGDTYSAIRTFQERAMPNAYVVSEPGTLSVGEDSFHYLPSGYKFDEANYQFGTGLNIFLYHGLVKGPVEFTDKGIPLETFDRPDLDLVLCGDVHTPLNFKTKHTTGGYVGSTLRLTENDAGDMRGWVDVQVQKGCEPICTLIEGGGPQFNKIVLSADTSTWPDPAQYTGSVVIATLKGLSSQLRPITDEYVRSTFPGCRVEIHREYEHEVANLVDGISAETNPLEDVTAFIAAADKGGLSKERLIEKAASISQSLPERKGLFA